MEQKRAVAKKVQSSVSKKKDDSTPVIKRDYWRSAKEWLENAPNKFGCDDKDIDFKLWEFFVFIIGCYLKEIIELIIATVSSVRPITYYDGSRSLIGALTPGIHPLEMELFWVMTLKVFLGFVLLLYMNIKYSKSFALWYLVLIWVVAIINPTLASYSTEKDSWGRTLIEMAIFSTYALSILFLFLVDKNNIDSLKVLLYEGLEYNWETGRVMKTPWSKITARKVEKLVFSIIAIFTISSFLVQIAAWIVTRAASGGKEEIKAENQAIIENRCKKDFFMTAMRALILAPLAEEVIYRKCIMKLANYRWVSVFVSGMIFGLIHMHYEGLGTAVLYIIPGIVFAVATKITKNIWYGIFAHLLNNFIAIIFSCLV